MKVWITKYALTKGIYSIDADSCENIDVNMIRDRFASFPTYYHKPDWHEKLVDAIDHGEQMRAKKIKSLQNKIKKLETMDITPSE